jgi:phosphatidylglycerol---prolipoprotein diacylglyceryl transferase
MDQYVHSLSPILFQITDGIAIRWYGLSYLAGFIVAYILVDLMAKRGTILLKREEVSDFITFMAIGVLAGGRIGYVLFYSPDLLTKISSTFPYWGALEVHKGGMSSHGGMLGVILTAYLFGRMKKISGLHILDLCTFGGSIGFFFGRIANFINGELYGREAPAALKWAVKFPQEIYHWGAAEAEKLKALAPAVEALGSIRGATGQMITATTDTWYQWVNQFDNFARANIDFYKEALVQATQSHNAKVLAAIAPALTPRYPSQLIQSVLEGLIVFILLCILWMKPRKPGFITAVFGIAYGVARIIGEEFRLPDYGIGYQWLGLTRGQWLSIALVTGALIFMAYILRKPAALMGGWGLKGRSELPPQNKK